MGITSKYGESHTAAAVENTFCWYKAGLTLKINSQGILIILKKLPNVVNLAPILGARESQIKIKTKRHKPASTGGEGTGNRLQGASKLWVGPAHKLFVPFFLPGGSRPQVICCDIYATCDTMSH
jgi:hypothetical protein